MAVQIEYKNWQLLVDTCRVSNFSAQFGVVLFMAINGVKIATPPRAKHQFAC